MKNIFGIIQIPFAIYKKNELQLRFESTFYWLFLTFRFWNVESKIENQYLS